MRLLMQLLSKAKPAAISKPVYRFDQKIEPKITNANQLFDFYKYRMVGFVVALGIFKWAEYQYIKNEVNSVRSKVQLYDKPKIPVLHL